MSQDTYQLVAMFVRYWLVFLMGMITFRALKWLLRERREYQKKLKVLPDAGFIGELVDLKTGDSYPLPREGYISGRRLADISLRGYRHQRLAFELEKGKGVAITPLRRGHRPALDGETLRGTAYALHGSVLDLGDRVLRFRLFAGLDVPSRGMPAQEFEGIDQMAPEMWAMDPALWPQAQWPQGAADGVTSVWPEQQQDDGYAAGYALVPPEVSAEAQQTVRRGDVYGGTQEEHRF